MSDSFVRASRELIRACNDMAKAGLVAGTWGNASVRIPGEDVAIITPSGMPYHSLTVSDMVAMDLSGGIRAGKRRPSTEYSLHLEIYRHRRDVQAIMHTHSVYASVLAVTRTDLPAIMEEQAQLVGGRVAVAEYAPAGSRELAYSASRALGNGGAVLLANHGLVGVGNNIDQALLVCQVVEKASQIYVLSRSVGRAFVLDESEVLALRNNFLTKYGQK